MNSNMPFIRIQSFGYIHKYTGEKMLRIRVTMRMATYSGTAEDNS